MSELLLDSLEIKNFRTFRHLQIEKLGRVNLITGKNSVGKTTLLEALRVYAGRGNPTLLWQLLSERDQASPPNRIRPTPPDEQAELLKQLFQIRIPRNAEHQLEVGAMRDPQKQVRVVLGWHEPRAIRGQAYLFKEEPIPALAIGVNVFNEPIIIGFEADRVSSFRDAFLRAHIEAIRHTVVAARNYQRQDLTQQWDAIALTAQESDVLDALKLLIPDVERVTLIGSETSPARLPFVRRVGKESPEPLRSLGDGMERLLSIALALVNARDGFLLVDEIENGLHYTIQVNMWRLVFQVARRLNVQVFTTTHSWDAIAAFQEAAREDTEAEGYLIRLEAISDGEIIPTIFDERKLAIATREHIEVR